MDVSERNVYETIERGDLPAVRFGRSVRVYRDAFEAWLGYPLPDDLFIGEAE